MKQNLTRVVTGLISAALLFTGVSACGSGGQGESGSTGLNQAKVINVGDQPAFFIFKIAQEKGFFAKELGDGVKVNVTQFVKQGPAIVEAISSNNVDLALLGTVPTVTANANNNHIVALSSGNYSENGFALFVNPKSDIHNVKDLKSKTIGLPFGTNEQEVAIELLQKNSLSTEDVQLSNLQSSDALTALKKGDIDAALLKGSDFYKAQQEGEVEIANNGETGPIANLIVGRQAFIEKNPELTQRFLKASAEAAQYVEEHPEEAIALEAKETGASTEDATINYKSRKRLVSDDNKYLSDPLQQTIAFAKQESLVSKDIHTTDIVDTSYFKKAGIQ